MESEHQINLKMGHLPVEIQREILHFIPRHPTAQIIYDSKHVLSLKYVRRFLFEDNLLYEKRIWDELNPVHLRSIFYGDTQNITRTQVSKGQYIQLKHYGII
jgi:hypothetical protein